jgi:hypothetical protein
VFYLHWHLLVVFWKLVKVVQIENTTSYIALIRLKNRALRYLHLVKRSDGTFQLESTAYKGEAEPASYEIVDSNRGLFIVLYGENTDLNMNEVWATVRIENTEYTYSTDVSGIGTFLKEMKISNDPEIEVSTVELTYLDTSNRKIEITK